MNATTILNKIIPIVSPNTHKTRREALIACLQSLTQGNLCTVTNIGRGIRSDAYEKHRIKIIIEPKPSARITLYLCLHVPSFYDK